MNMQRKYVQMQSARSCMLTHVRSCREKNEKCKTNKSKYISGTDVDSSVVLANPRYTLLTSPTTC